MWLSVRIVVCLSLFIVGIPGLVDDISGWGTWLDKASRWIKGNDVLASIASTNWFHYALFGVGILLLIPWHRIPWRSKRIEEPLSNSETPVLLEFKPEYQWQESASEPERAWFGATHSSVFHYYLMIKNNSNTEIIGLKAAITYLEPLPIQIHLPIHLEIDDNIRQDHIYPLEEKRIPFIERDMKGTGDMFGFHAHGGEVHYIYHTGDLTRSYEHQEEVMRLQRATFKVGITVYADGYMGREFYTTVRVNDDEQVEIGVIENSKQ